jgi:DNA polymerase III delta prime subunit
LFSARSPGLTCDLMGQIAQFLTKEYESEVGRAARMPIVTSYVLRCFGRDDFCYSFLQSSKELLKFEDGSWVKVSGGGHSQYGSVWLPDEGEPYLLTGEPVTPGIVHIVEADGIQLLEMQRQAFSRLQNGSSVQAQRTSDIISKKTAAYERTGELPRISFYDERVSENASQTTAIKRALTACQQDGFFLIHGPPGTGKTTVITEIVRHLADAGRKVLITSHTNVAVNNVMENLAPHLKSRMVRLGPKAKVSKSLKELVPITQDELVRIALSEIVGATLSKLSILVLNGKLSFDRPYFDVVIVDESSMATIPLTLAGILLGNSFILVGDHLQLPPITRTKLPPSCLKAETCGGGARLCESLFRLLIELYPERSQILDVQFRSHPHIMGFSAEYVYDRKIRSSEECFEKKLELQTIEREQVRGTINEKPICYVNMHYDAYDENPIEWFPSGSDAARKHRRPSCFNRYEAAVAIKIRHDFMKAGLPPEKIWIITPFRLQREIIKKAVRGIYGAVSEDAIISIYENLTASTVDSIQGKENDVVMYSLTWAPSEGREGHIHKALANMRRLNVALTRAKKKLIIIGDLARLSEKYPYGPLEKYMRDHNAMTFAKANETDDFLTVLQYYYSKKKDETIGADAKEKVREAKKRIRNDFPEKPSRPKVWRVVDEKTFEEFKTLASDLWEDLNHKAHMKIYDLRMRGSRFEVLDIYEKKFGKRAIYLRVYERYGSPQDELLQYI